MRIARWFCLLIALFLFAGPAQAQARFEGRLRVEFDPNGRHAILLEPYTFIDSKGGKWPVAKGAMIDGASIPRFAWSIIGGPFEGKYRNASVIHDWYCDRRTRPWREVHRMFHEAMLAAGVDPVTAKVMYTAVAWAGPRWDSQAIHNSMLPPADYMARISGSEAESFKVRNFAVLRAAVTTSDLTLDEIDLLVEQDLTPPAYAAEGVAAGSSASPAGNPGDEPPPR